MSLSNEQLILLDTLAYYSSFSDINNELGSNGQITKQTVANVISYIEKNSKKDLL
jgi:nicotinic acid mononucleotide adenylyltransferase